MRAGFLVALALLFSPSFSQNPSKRTGRTRGHGAGSSLSSSASRTAYESSGDEWRPPSGLALAQTPRGPRPPRQVATTRSTAQAQVAPSSTTPDDEVIEISDSSEEGEEPPPSSVAQPVLPETRDSIAPPSQLGDSPASRANSVVNPLDLDDPVYRAPTPDTPERVGRRHLLLDQPPLTPEFYERGDAASNDTSILTADRFLRRTLHPQFVFNRDERAQLFDRALDQVSCILRQLEFTTNADFLLTMGLPDDRSPDDIRLSRVVRSRTIESSDYYRGISERIASQFRHEIADTRRSELEEWLEYAQWEADQREQARARTLERAAREIREQEQALAAAAAAAAAEQRAAAAAAEQLAAAAHNKPADESQIQRTNAKRPNTSPGKQAAPAKKRKDDDGKSNSGVEKPAARKKPAVAKQKATVSAASKGKGKQKAVDPPSVSTSEGTPGGSGGVAGTSADASGTEHQTGSGADASSLEQDDDDDDPDWREAIAASIRSAVTDDEKRLGQPVASSSNSRLDDIEPGEHNALAPQTNQPHRPDPILPTAVALYLAQTHVPYDFWAAIELVWTTTPPAAYPDALASVNARCGLALTPADIYSLALLLSRTPPPRRSQ